MSYDVIGVKADGTVVESIRQWRRAPNGMQLFEWGRRRACAVVIRFWPSRKGWMPLDIRKARIAASVGDRRSGFGGYSQLVGAHRWRVFPNKEAAIMYTIHKLAAQPEFDFAAQ